MEKIPKMQADSDRPLTTVEVEQEYFKKGDTRNPDIVKNIFIISFGFMITNFADGIFSISSYNYLDYYGYGSEVIFWIISILVILWIFTNSYILKLSTIKLSLWISMVGLGIYFLIKSFDSGYFMIGVVAYVLIRMCSAQMWISSTSYLLDSAKRHTFFGGKSFDVRAVRFLAVLNCFYQIGSLFANSYGYSYVYTNETYDENVKITSIISIILPVVSAALVIIFLDGIADEESSSPAVEQANTTYSNKSNLLLPLIPITLWVGLRSILLSYELVLFWGHYMKTEIICYGIISSLTSLAVGIVIKYCSRVKLFCVAALIDLVVIISLIVLQYSMNDEYNGSRTKLLAVILMFEGAAGAIWNTLLPAFYGVIYSDNSALSACSKYFGVKYIGLFIVSVMKYNFSGIGHLVHSVQWKVLVTLFIILIFGGMLGYFRIENQEQKKKTSTPHSNPLPHLHEPKGANV